MTNLNGKSYAMNAITPMKPWKTPILKLLFFLLSHIKLMQADLKNLSFIHFARWVVVKRRAWPRLDESQAEEHLRYDYLLFFSNFNGTWNQYIDAFSDVLAYGLNLVWRWSEKYPGALPVSPFKRYIAQVQFDTDYYYNAYPHATTNDVKAAHRVNAALKDFADRSKQLTPEEFGAAYRAFTVQVQCDLGATGASPIGT
jgi:hypothetical protein